MDNRPIGFFDSGIGGLTCIPAMQRMLPNEHIVYYGDTGRTPYGSKSPDTIRAFSYQITDYLMSHDVKMIVIACNTITATCLDDLQKRHPEIPIIGIIGPMVYRIVNQENDGSNIGVIGTKATVSSNTYANKIHEKNPDINVFTTACPALVPLIEEGIIDNEIMDLTVKYYLDDFIRENNIRKLVLGCTHYPFVKRNIQKLYPDLKLLNPSDEVVSYIKKVLVERDMLADQDPAEHLCYASDLSENFYNVLDMVFKDSDDFTVNFKKFE